MYNFAFAGINAKYIFFVAYVQFYYASFSFGESNAMSSAHVGDVTSTFPIFVSSGTFCNWFKTSLLNLL